MLRNARTRLIAASALLAILSTSLVLGVFYWTASAVLEGETRQVVNAELTGLADDYRSLGVRGLASAIERRLGSADRRDAVYLLTDARGNPIAGNLKDWPATVEPGSGWVELDLFRTDRDERVRAAAASIQLRGGERLLVGRDSSGRTRFEQALVDAALLALLAAVLLSLVTGWLLSRLVFSRLADISRTAKEIVSGDLTMRVPARGTGDEFDQLSTTLNSMLDRIEALVANLRTTTDSLSHDLRSPLTRLSAQVEELSRSDLPDAEREELSRRAQAEASHLLRVFTALTEISRAEAGLARAEFSPVNLNDLAADAAELYEPVAAEQDVTITVSGGPSSVVGHGPLLAQALSNLLENALRYAPEGSTLQIDVGSAAGIAHMSVADSGPGIPEDQRNRVLERFTTLDAARQARGAGLGLALVSAVAQLHNGDVVLTDNRPGLVATLRLSAKGQNGNSSGTAKAAG